MGVSEIISIFEKYGIKGIISIILLFGSWTFIRSQWFTKLFNVFIEKYFSKKKNINRSISQSDILNHDIFSYIDFWTFSKVPTFQFSTEYRTIIFRKYLTIFLKKYKENLSKYVIDKQYEEMDDSELWKSFLSLTNNIIYEYEKEMESAGIPKIIIEKMKVKNNDTISLTIDLIEGICSSQFYSSDKNLLKIYSILNIMLSVLENTISNSDTICNSINGSLSGLQISDGSKTFREP